MADTTRPRALVTSPLRGDAVARIERLLDLVRDPWIDYRPLRVYDPKGLAARAEEVGAEYLIVETDFVGPPVYDLPIRAIWSTRGDPNNVDVTGATAAGIPVMNTPARNADAVAEITVGLLFAVTRHVLPADRDLREGQVFRDGTVPYQRYRAWQVAGRTAGIVGLGAIGRALKWRLEGLGMRVISHDPYNPEATHSLDDLLAESDVVSLHAPVVPATKGMIGPEQFARMRDGAVFLNAARAQLHDMDALVEALRRGKLSGAALDHFEGEQLPTDHPLIGMDNVVLTPHVGGATYDVEVNQTEMVADDLERLLAGERPRHIVNPEVLS